MTQDPDRIAAPANALIARTVTGLSDPPPKRVGADKAVPGTADWFVLAGAVVFTIVIAAAVATIALIGR